MPLKMTSRSSSISSVYLIVALFIAMFLMLILLVQVQMNALVAVRAYIGAEGLWAKAQKDATRSLEHYALSHDESDFQSYLHFIQVPLGDLKTRIELQKINPDLNIARAGFLEGGNSPKDIEYMIDLFLRFQHASFMAEAIGHWEKADQLIAELDDEAKALHDVVTSGAKKTESIHGLLARLEFINRHLTEQENQFSATLANASRWATDVSRNATYFIAIIFTLLGIGISWRIIFRMRSIEDKLSKSEAALRIAATAFESHESMMITDTNGVILRVNKAFVDDTGYTPEDIQGQTPRILKSGRHNAEFYRAMWETLRLHGKWEGEIFDRRKNGEIYPKWLTISAVKGDDGAVTHYVGSHIDITERKAADDEIKNLAFYDPLTRLPNRRLLLDRLNQSLAASARNSRKGALLFIDLDNFKTLNDTLGHDIGDLLLQQVAQRLASCVREGDTVARLGGDEFVVMLDGLSESSSEAAAQTEAVGEKILSSLNQPYTLDEHEQHSTPSIGATLFGGQPQPTDDLLKQADIAMYQSKKAGRNTLRFFDPKMQEIINANAFMERELRKALENNEFELYYQIQVTDSGIPIGAEALIRWLHPERGMVSPAQFIPLAEESGLILPIGQWVLEAACAQLKLWQKASLTRDITLSINVSAIQFRQTDFISQVQATAQRHAINPNVLKLELTESLLVEDIDGAIASMKCLSEFGVKIALDDFGTGFSSLQYLKKLPIDQLKVDQTFVRDITIDEDDQAIIGTIIAMAHNLRLDVIAEGVETEEQREFLLSKGCKHYQGYLFGKPLPIEAFEASLRKF